MFLKRALTQPKMPSNIFIRYSGTVYKISNTWYKLLRGVGPGQGPYVHTVTTLLYKDNPARPIDW
jgi:hypothetical protein